MTPWPDYLLLRHVHITTVVITASLFVLRWVWALRGDPRLRRRWARVLPHVNDTVLLAAGLAMAWRLQQYPFVHAWLTAKVFALIVYILCGTVAIKRGRTTGHRAVAGVLALLSLAYLMGVAMNRSPWAWLA